MSEPRRCFCVSTDDAEYLENAFPNWEAIDGRWILLPDFMVCPGYTVQTATVAIHIPTSYPITRLDMAYFSPPIVRTDGKTIPATNCFQMIDGKQFQRWSRHYQPNSWKPDEDCIATHVMAIQDWLLRAAPTEGTG